MKNFKELISFNNVRKYLKSTDNIIISYENKDIRIFTTNPIKEIIMINNYFGFDAFRENIIVLVDFNYQGHYYDMKNNRMINQLTQKFDKIVFSKFFQNKGLFQNKNKNPRTTGLYEFQNDNILWEGNDIYDVWGIHEKGIYARGDKMTSVEFYSLENGSLLWQYSVSEIGRHQDLEGKWQEGKVERIVGVLDEVLVVVVKGVAGIGTHQLISLDTNTGNLLWQLANYEYQGKTYEAITATAYFLMPTPDNQHVIGFSYGFYIKIDPKTGKIIRFKKLYEDTYIQWKDYEIKSRDIDSGSVVDNLIFFRTSTSKHSGFPNTIGAFNFHTEEIEWLHEFEEFSTSGRFLPNGQPKAEGNRVYALDSGNTLHIFEKEY